MCSDPGRGSSVERLIASFEPQCPEQGAAPDVPHDRPIVAGHERIVFVQGDAPHSADVTVQGGGHEVLSHRETDILRLVASGLTNQQVARELGISRSTVKTQVNAILSKLGLPSRTQAALYAARTGLIALDHVGSDAAPAALHDLLQART